MLQRIQTVYMIGVLLACGLLFIVDIADFPSLSLSIYGFEPLDATLTTSVMAHTLLSKIQIGYLLGLVITMVVLNQTAIFLYSNRKLQIILNRLSILLWLTFIALSLVSVNSFQTFRNDEIGVDIGAFLPFVGIVCNTLAIRHINKDTETMRSMDRIR